MDNVAEPVHVRVLDRVLREKVMLDELHPSLLKGFRVLARPDLGLALLEDRGAVLNNKVELRVDVGKLKAEAT